MRVIKLKMDSDEQDVHDFFMKLSQAILGRYLQQSEDKDAAASERYQRQAYIFDELLEIFSNIFEKTVIRQHHLMLLLLRLRQITCHPCLILNQLLPEDEDDYNGHDLSLHLTLLTKLFES